MIFDGGKLKNNLQFKNSYQSNKYKKRNLKKMS